MKKFFLIISASLLVLASNNVMGQNQNIILDSVNTHGATFTTCDANLVLNQYGSNEDYTVTMCANNVIADRLVLYFDTFNIHSSDTLWLHAGTGTNSLNNPLISLDSISYDTVRDLSGNIVRVDTVVTPFTAFTKTRLNNRSVLSPLTHAGCITARFKSNASNNQGSFKAKVSCEAKCQSIIPTIDTFFLQVHQDGSITRQPIKRDLIDSVWRDSIKVTLLPLDTLIGISDYYVMGTDTIWGSDEDTVFVTDTIRDTLENAVFDHISLYSAIDICEGDSIILVAKVFFPENDMLYHQSDSTCLFLWNYGDCATVDSIYGSHTAGHKWQDARGFTVSLYVEDTVFGCMSNSSADIRVRISKNPIRAIAQLPEICSGTELAVSAGYGGDASIQLNKIQQDKAKTGYYVNTVVLPDGPPCADFLGGQFCFKSPITFNSFGLAKIQSKEDVYSICLDIEHTFIGDLGVTLYCPPDENGVTRSVILKHMLATGADGGADLGYPPYGTSNPCSPGCWDSCITPGVGGTYCWSNQAPYTNPSNNPLGLWTNYHQGSPSMMPLSNPEDSTNYYQTPDQRNYMGPTPSNPVGPRSPYVTSDITEDRNAFAELIGCPMNGQWIIEICDYWGGDDGYIFGWNLSLKNSCFADWAYSVDLDTLFWEGPFMHAVDNSNYKIIPPIDTGGVFRYGVHIVDNLGCEWDTAVFVNILETPVIDLGDDIKVCEGEQVILDATHRAATDYIWSDGSIDPALIIVPQPNSSDMTYYVQVVNNSGSFPCSYQDSVHLIVKPQALPSFISNPSPLVGCEPFTFQLFNASSNVDTFEWQVGDFISTEMNPVFTLPYGIYQGVLRVKSEGGCTDSLSFSVDVYPKPVADFAWEPNNPFASAPDAQMINLTQPDLSSNTYLWRYQTDKYDATAFSNVTGKNPIIHWTQRPNEPLAGDYDITLFAYVNSEDIHGGQHQCYDSITKTITIINDNLIFPNVVTPNGDGKNDTFIVHNLVGGRAFPDNELTIYNRYGRRIYFKEDIRVNEEGWDPNETNTPAGTYFYHFVGRGPVRDVEYTGTIEVIRK
ncbi:MAG: gliding motility-associated C-terminal domain-containing protein [Bacteroidales bacterium]|jgi:gliding motility-associated-like protein|nr:gliding motility-associated C-terminal domain-containing protein [Bacteroidales bacterium]